MNRPYEAQVTVAITLDVEAESEADARNKARERVESILSALEAERLLFDGIESLEVYLIG